MIWLSSRACWELDLSLSREAFSCEFDRTSPSLTSRRDELLLAWGNEGPAIASTGLGRGKERRMLSIRTGFLGAGDEGSEVVGL